MDNRPALRGELSRFLAAGAVNTGLTYLLYLALLAVLPYVGAYTIAYVSGIALSYVLNARFVFRTPLSLGAALRFPLVYVVQYATGSCVLVAAVDGAGVSRGLGMLAAIAVSVPATFALSRGLLRRQAARRSTEPVL